MDAGQSDDAPRVSLGFGGQPECGRAENRGFAPGAAGARGHGGPLSGSLCPRLVGASGAGRGQCGTGESRSGAHTRDYELHGYTKEKWQLRGVLVKVGNRVNVYVAIAPAHSHRIK